MRIIVRPLGDADRADWQRMRTSLWPDDVGVQQEHAMRAWRARPDAATFVALRADESVCGFVEVGARPYADGCDTSPVGFIEGWYVDPDMRRRGAGRALLVAAEAWAVANGYREMASDALLDNTLSHQAHAGVGYAEVGRVVQFRKPLM